MINHGYWIECNRCHTTMPVASSEYLATWIAQNAGWLVAGPRKDYCPECRKKVES